MVKFDLVDGCKLCDPFNHEIIKAVIFDKKLAKEVAEYLNRDESHDDDLKNELKALKIENASLHNKLKIRDEVLEENQIKIGPGRKRKDADGNLIPRKKAEFKSKMCPGFGSIKPHLFIPRCGKQTMCKTCRQAMLDAKKGTWTKKKPALTTTIRGQTSVASENYERIPTISEVLDMLPGPERTKWESRWSPAERQQATIEKTRRERERMRAMKRHGFSPDDPIMGVNAKKLV